MEVDADQNKNGGDGGGSVPSLRLKISKLQRKLLEEKDRYDLSQSESTFAKLVSSQEADRCRRECSSLRETVLRLKEDCSTLREREARDQQAIKGLLEAIERKEREYFELKMENADLEREKRRAQDEVFLWKEKYGEVEAQALRLFDENRKLKEKEKAAAEKAKGREYGELESVILKVVEKKFHLKNVKGRPESEIDEELQSPEPRRERKFAAVGGDSIPLSKKRHVEVSEGNEKDSGSLRPEEGTSAEVAGARIRSVPAFEAQKVSEGASAKVREDLVF